MGVINTAPSSINHAFTPTTVGDVWRAAMQEAVCDNDSMETFLTHCFCFSVILLHKLWYKNNETVDQTTAMKIHVSKQIDGAVQNRNRVVWNKLFQRGNNKGAWRRARA